MSLEGPPTVEPFTHALVSLGIARAAQRRLPRFGTLMLVVSGVFPDLDYLSYFGGATAFLGINHAALHSLAGAAAASSAIAAAFCALDQKFPVKPSTPIDPDGIVIQEPWAPMAFRAAALVCAVGILGHILLDLASGVGVELLWPFYTHWFGWSLAPEFDLWIVLLLGAALILPLLFKLVNEEVGDHRKGSGRRSAAIALVLVAVYLGGRGEFHSRAIDLLLAREYRGQIPLAGGAFPASSNPLLWRGLAVTDNTIEEVEVNTGPGADFDADRSMTHYKPGDSPALDAAENTAVARRFLRYAKFPLAAVARREAGYRVEIRDLRFAPGDAGAHNIVVRVDLDSDARVTAQELRFASEENP